MTRGDAVRLNDWRPSVGGLFAGYGGLEMALHDVFGAEPAWFCEFEPPKEPGKKPPRQAASMILAHHWPDVPNHGDVTAVDWSTVEPVDIIAGGSPCQDVSHAGKRAGMKSGTRSGLWASMSDAIDVIRPSLVVWENVHGALSAEATSAVEPCPICMGDGSRVTLRALGRVLGDLAELGYDAAWTGLRAADIGAPHGRFRVFVVAWPQSDPGALSWPQSDPGALSWPQSDPGALLPTPVVNDMGAAYTPDEWDEWTTRLKASHGNGNGHGASLSVEALRLLPTPRTSDTNGAGEHGTGGADLRTVVSLLPTPTTTQRGIDARASDRPDAGPNLHNAVMALLPTPTAMDSRASGGNPDTTGSHGTTLTDTLVRNPRRSNADPTAADARQDLPRVRGDFQPEALQGGSREQPALPSEGLLLAELCEHAGDRDEGRAALASTKAPGASVRGVWDDDGAARTPHRPEPGEQRPVESHDAVRVLSPEPALAGGQAAAAGRCGEGEGYGCSTWGHYAPAVHRWEMVLGRLAPAPTEPTGRDGAQRLASRAVEHMQGLPAGHVTDVPGITRNDMLKALGNGVVPQQGAEGVRRCIATAWRWAVAS